MSNHSLSNDLLYIQAVKEGRLTVTRSGKVKNNSTGRWIGCLGSSGYLHIALRIKGKARSMYIHRLVWLVYKGIIPQGYEINHKNGNKLFNSLSNLEQVTPSGNIKHSYKSKLRVYADPNSKFVRNEVENIRKKYHNKEVSIEDIMQKYSVSRESVLDMLKGKTFPKEKGAVKTIRNILTAKEIEISARAKYEWGYSYADIREYFAITAHEETIRFHVQKYMKGNIYVN